MNLQECLIHATLATRLGQLDYGTACCQHILKRFPNHLRAKSVLGQACLEKGLFAEAATCFEDILEQDVENVLARSGFAVALEKQGQLKRAIGELERAFDTNPGNVEVREGLVTLRSQLERVNKGIELGPTAKGRILAKKQKSVEALEFYSQAMETNPHRIDVHLGKIQTLWYSGRKKETEDACKEALRLAPRALKAKTTLALTLLKRGDEEKSVALLHEVRVEDPSDSVLGPLLREFGLDFPNPYDVLEIGLPPGAPPPEVTSALAAGLALEWQDDQLEDLPSLGIEIESKSAPRESHLEFTKVADRLSDRIMAANGNQKVSGLVDAYVIISSAANLRKKYGPDGLTSIRRKLQGLQSALSFDGFSAHVVFSDDPESIKEFGLTPARPDRPQEVKRVIDGIEGYLSSRQESFKYLLIIGGDDIVPFFRLANPTDDDDSVVLSDSPYGVAGAKFYSPTRAVGRIPDGSTNSPSFLLSLIDRLLSRRVYVDNDFGFWRHLSWLFNWLNPGQGRESLETLGYTALVWKQATEAVYKDIGDPKSLRMSPPMTDRGVDVRWFDRRHFGLYNLHGTENSPYWYGQKDGTYPADYPVFPVALSPDSLREIDASDAIIFSEACYGANIIGKDVPDSLALQFLKLGAACVVGSTKIAYGSTEPPLVGADLLARNFWDGLRGGLTAGEALVQARKHFVSEVQARQGYLDGDDQKTIIEFVLLGDPAAKLPANIANVRRNGVTKSVLSQEEEEYCPSLFCKRRARALEQTIVTGDVLAKVRKHLQKVGPDVFDSTLSVLPREICGAKDRNHVCRGTCLIRGEKRPPAGAYMVTSRKSVQTQDGVNLSRVARVTVDEQGVLLKLAVSK